MTIGIGGIDLAFMPQESLPLTVCHIGIQSQIQIGGIVSVADGPAGLTIMPQLVHGGEPFVERTGIAQHHLIRSHDA